MNRDRRLLARKRPAEFGFIQIDHDEGGRILNISEGGLCFETFAPIEQERLLRFWFSLNLRERVEASGRLTWIDQRRKVGGLQFLDLSPRGRKHLRAHLGAEPIRVAGRLQSEDPSAKGGAFLAALAKQSMDGPAPQPPTRGTFLAALAKQSMDGLAPQLPVRQGSAIQTPAIQDRATQAWNPAEQDFERNAELERGGTAGRSETRFFSRNDSANATAFVPFERQRSELQRAGAAAQSETQIAFENGSANGTAFVPFERHRTNGRRKFLGGVVLGSVLSLAVGAAGGWFLAQQPPVPGRAPVTPFAAPPAAATAPVMPGGSVGTGGPGTSNASGAAGSVLANTSAPTARRTSADHAAATKASMPSALSSQAAETTHGAGLTPTRESETLAGKKPRRTLKQLWAAVQAGNANAAVELADHYIQGDGVLVNCDQARILLLVASEKNNAEAIKKLRDLDRTGCGAQGATK